MRKTFICIGIRKTLETLTTLGSSGTKRGERDTISTKLTVPSDPTTRGASRRPNWPGLAEVRKSTRFVQLQISTNCFFFKNHPKSSAHRFRA